MTSIIPNERLISHGIDFLRTQEDLLQSIKKRLREMGDFSGITVEQQMVLLDQLSHFELGQFLLQHRGLNAYWTHQLVAYTGDVKISGLERQIFECLPTVLATRERFGIFRAQLQSLLQPGFVLASVPCGWMGELLLLDYAHYPDIQLVGVDLDQQALNGARILAEQKGLADRLTLYHEDAWAPSLHEKVDVLTSNGLNIYERNDARVIALYRAFGEMLKPGGTLVTSFLTPPPTVSPDSSWDLTYIDPAALTLQQLIFMRFLDVKWSAFRTQEQTKQQLAEAGFTNCVFINDRAGMFPTVVAKKAG